MYWLGMHFVVLLGEGEGTLSSIGSTTALIRSNSVGSMASLRSATSMRSTVSIRSSSSQDQRRRRKPYVMAVRVDVSVRDDISVHALKHLYPDRFQCVSVEMPSVNESLGPNLNRLALALAL